MPEQEYIFVTSSQELEKHCAEIKEKSDWIGFDTEFIGERRYVPLLCLVQIASEVGNLLIDTLAFEDMSALTDLMADESILKITHAGENDYQLFYKLFKTLPKNVVDVQVAVGFLGDGYPSSFQKIVQKYAKVKISKSQTVTDWSRRPIRDKQIHYALNDVIYLKQIWEKLKGKLEKHNRLEWVLEECSKFCNEENYTQDLIGDILSNKLMHALRKKEQLLNIRLMLWRENEAKTNNLSKEKVLSSKIIPVILKMIGAGKQSLLSDRRIPDYVIKKNWETLNSLYNAPMTEEEEDLLGKIQPPPDITEEHGIMMDMLNQIFKFICAQNRVAGTLLMPRSDFNKMKYESDYIPSYLREGWRKEVLGSDMATWLENRDNLSVRFEDGELRIGV
ncbi:MAG: ribonuclease D [Maribacter sp.]|jgi:ribonuclease D